MKNVTLKLAVLSALGYSAYALATPVSVPTTGFATSAYTSCNTTGNFGSGSVGNGNPTVAPSSSTDACVYYPAPASDVTSPETGYTIAASAVRTITVNNIYTGGTGVNVGSVNEYVWRKPAATAPVTSTPMCIYGAKITLSNIDYNSVEAGKQTFEVNDLARGGFDGLAVDAAYAVILSTASPVYRVGRTYTSVQHRAEALSPNYGDFGGANPGTNYLALPGLTGSTAAINGVNRYTGTTPNTLPLANPTLPGEQAANVNDSWVNFTFDANAVDDDGSTNAVSSMTYVKAACTTAAPVTRTDAIRLRQTAQEKSPFISVSVTGYVPPSAPATLAPAATAPF